MEESRDSYLAVKQDTKLLLDKLGVFLSDVTEGDEHSVPSAQALLDQQLTKAFEAYYTLKRKFDEDELRVAFLALTKSGKSTLLNAFIGSTILPSNNVPETARIVAIKHLPGATGEQATLTFNDRGKTTRVEGEDGIRTQLKYLNQEARGRQHRMEDNLFLNVSLEVAALRNEASEDQGVALTLLDTPGPNEAGEDALRHQVDRLLQDVGCCVWVLDFTKLKTEEERCLLAKLRDMNPQLMERLSQRLFFVVNKVDLIHSCDGLDEDELREYVADLITSQLNNEAFQLLPEQVLLVSAQNAQLSRLVLSDKASAKERTRFGNLAFGRMASRMDESQYRKAAAEMLQESGLPELEEKVLQYLFNNAGVLKLLALLDDITCQLHQVQNVALIGRGSLQQGAKQLEAEAAELHAQLQLTLAQFNTIQTEAQLVEAEVVDNVQVRLQTLKERLFEHVEEVLDFSREPTLTAVQSGRWRSVFDKAVQFFTRRGGEASASRVDMQAKLQDLHDSINAQIEAEVRDFWGALEVSTNAKQVQMLGSINSHLERLARQIEHLVGAALDVRLEPVLIRMEPPSAQEFHSSLQDLFRMGIGERSESQTRVREENYYIWERRFRGLCRTSEYYVARPATRTIEENYIETTYQLQPDRIKEYFTRMIDGTIQTSLQWVRSYVHAYLSENVASARKRIETYGLRYTDTMQAALLTKSQGAEVQERGVQSMERHLARIGELLVTATLVGQRAARVFPQAADAGFCWVQDNDGTERDSVPPQEVAAADDPGCSIMALREARMAEDGLASMSSEHFSEEFQSVKSAGTAPSEDMAPHTKAASAPALEELQPEEEDIPTPMKATPPPKEEGIDPDLLLQIAEATPGEEGLADLDAIIDDIQQLNLEELMAQFMEDPATMMAQAKGMSERLPATPTGDGQAAEQAKQEEVTPDKPIAEDAKEEKASEQLAAQEQVAQQKPLPEAAQQESSQQLLAHLPELAHNAEGAAEEGCDHVTETPMEAGRSQAQLVEAAGDQGGLRVNLPLESGIPLELPVSDGQHNTTTVYSGSSNAESPKSAQTGSDSAVLVAESTDVHPAGLRDSAIMQAVSDEDSDGWELTENIVNED